MSLLDGDLMLSVWRRRRELGRTTPTLRPPLPRLKRRLEIHPLDQPWPVLRNYPYGQIS
jgi:hypothetical protein